MIESCPSVTGASPAGGGVGAGASHRGCVGSDVGLVSCDQRFDREIVDDNHVDSSDEELPPHGLVDSSSEEEVDKKRLTPQKRKSRKARLAIARALQPARVVVENAKLTEEINELDEDKVAQAPHLRGVKVRGSFPIHELFSHAFEALASGE